jgi:hypothetical protein
LAKWSVACCPKDQSGLGIHNLSVKNTALMGKWLFNLLTEEGTWQTILKTNILAQKHYPRFFGNQVIHIFGRTDGNKEFFSSA